MIDRPIPPKAVAAQLKKKARKTRNGRHPHRTSEVSGIFHEIRRKHESKINALKEGVLACACCLPECSFSAHFPRRFLAESTKAQTDAMKEIVLAYKR